MPNSKCHNYNLQNSSMNEIFFKYLKYLAKLPLKPLQKQLQLMSIKKTGPNSKLNYINLLSRSKPELIQKRIAELPTVVQHQEQYQEGFMQSSASNVKILYSFQIRQMRQKLKEVQARIYFDLESQYQNTFGLRQKTLKNNNQPVSASIKEESKYIFDEQPYLAVPNLNLIMNAQTSIELHPDSIKKEFQDNVSSLVKSIFPQQTELSLTKKEESFSRKLLGEKKLQGELIQNLLMLYGLRKQQELELQLMDPLQNLLHNKKPTNHQKLNQLASFINMIDYRRSYYEQIMIHLPLDQLLIFTKLVSDIKQISVLNEITKSKRLLQINELILLNKHFLKGHMFIMQTSELKSSNSVASNHFQLVFQIQFQILQRLEDFCQNFQNQQFSEKNIIDICQALSSYLLLKKKVQNITEQRQLSIQMSNQQLLASFFQQSFINQWLKLKRILYARETDQFYEKIFQIMQFLDMKKVQETKYLQVYAALLKTTLYYEDTQVPAHIFNKFIDDHIIVFKRHLECKFMDQSYKNLFTQFSNRNVQKLVTDDKAKLVSRIIWQNISQHQGKHVDMTFAQGKYFLMSLHILSSYSKMYPEIQTKIVNSTILIEVFKKYLTMIQKNKKQFDTLNKQSILQLLATSLDQLLKYNEHKSQIIGLLLQKNMFNQAANP